MDDSGTSQPTVNSDFAPAPPPAVPRRRRLRRPLENALLGLADRVVPRLSRRAVLRLAGTLGTLAYLASPHLRRVGRANLRLVFGDRLPAPERRRLLRHSFRNFALVGLDMLWFGRDTRRRLAEWVRLDPQFEEVALKDRPQILITGHLGNWEILGQAIAARGAPLMSVAAPLLNPEADDLMVRHRQQSGQVIVPREGAVRKLVRHLRHGGKTAMLLDQNTKPSEGGIFVDFFGLPVPVSPAAAVLSRLTGADLYFGYCVPQADGHYFAPPFVPVPNPERGEDAAAARALTRRLTGVAEEIVRRHPEYWLWSYKRWKHIPPGADRAAYPFYAKPLVAAEVRLLARAEAVERTTTGAGRGRPETGKVD